jgi:uncharacterized protein (TIGR03435 family)
LILDRCRSFAVVASVFALFVLTRSVAARPSQNDPKSAGALAFEVVSVKRRTPAEMAGPPGVMHFTPTGFRYSGRRLTGTLPLNIIIVEAYSITDMQLVGPKWLNWDSNSDSYEIEAIMPEGTNRPDSLLMLRTMLADRFGLRFHRETKDVPGYNLSISSRGHKLQASSTDKKSTAPKINGPAGPVKTTSRQRAGHFQAWAMTMPDFVGWLSGWTGHPVTDSTGLTGRYDIELQWEPGEAGSFGGRPDDANEVFQAVERQLGLRLERKTVPLEMFVIDHVDRMPTPN